MVIKFIVSIITPLGLRPQGYKNTSCSTPYCPFDLTYQDPEDHHHSPSVPSALPNLRSHSWIPSSLPMVLQPSLLPILHSACFPPFLSTKFVAISSNWPLSTRLVMASSAPPLLM